MSATPDSPNGSTAAHHALLGGYATLPGVYDELVDAHGNVRPRWRELIDAFAAMGPAAVRGIHERADRMLRENDVTFVARGDRERVGRPWRLDLLPFLIDAEEWAHIERGLAQRAELLNRILADLYGEQRALKEGRLPAGVVFGNLQFLRPCTNVPVENGHYLHFVAFDIARSPDGTWWVLSDRSEAPSGAGFALENRVVSTRCLPELFAGANVHRQASFFRAFSDHLLGHAERDEPLAVFLSRGPSKRTYFEHVYLARYLGYPVVEGSDLTVRDDRLFLKTVRGLRPVDLVMRSVRSEMCDPLELRTDSQSGVPGLLQAARAGHVTIANALGSGLVASDAFLSFLPGLSRFYLDEALAMPSVATWWCGQRVERDYVLANLDALVIKRVSSTTSFLSGVGHGRVGTSGSGANASLRRQIELAGHDFVGQESLTLSTAPVFGAGGTLAAAPVVIRVYVAATGDGYRVMPGGLTRTALAAKPSSARLAAGDVSKDTWVVADGPAESFSLLAQRADGTRLRRGGKDLPSRAADHLFWLGRYTERAEAAVRLLRSLVIRLRGEMGSNRPAVSSERVVSLLVNQKHLSARRGRRAIQEGRAAVEQALWTILFDPESKDGLATVLGNVRRTADVVRERLSFDTYRILHDLTDAVGAWSHGPQRDAEDALRLLNRLIQYLAAFNGMVMENMTRGYGWRFLDMGRRLERLRSGVDLLKQLTVRGDPEGDGALSLLLELADSTMTYRGRYQAAPRLPAVLDLLLADDSNPRSAYFQVERIAEHVEHLPRPDEDGVLNQRITTRLGGELELTDVVRLAETQSRFGTRVELDRLARRVEQDVGELSDAISHRFFSYSRPRRVSGTGRGSRR